MTSYITILFFCLIPIYALNILHLSDAHLDLKYEIGSFSSCEQDKYGLKCCRNNSIGIYPYTKASKYGSFNCDSSSLLINNTLKYISKHHIVDIIIYTGDTVNHHDFDQSLDDNINTIYNFHMLLLKYFPNSTILPTIGNHDTFPVDQMSSKFHLRLFKQLYSIWNIKEEYPFLMGGYYKYDIGNITFISLNSIYYDDGNIFTNDPQSERQYNWLIDILDSSRKNNKSCLIISHLFPYNSGMKDKHSMRLDTHSGDILIAINFYLLIIK
jgi:3',5'-cyclic AMP phosphodiesterase CpdA